VSLLPSTNKAPAQEKRPMTRDQVALRRKIHQTIRKVSEDLENFHHNTAVSALMELSNAIAAHIRQETPTGHDEVVDEAMRALVVLLSPMAPHIAEELWRILPPAVVSPGSYGSARNAIPGPPDRKSVFLEPWPTWREEALQQESYVLVVQVDGKLRSKITVSVGTPHPELETRAKLDPKVAPHLKHRQIKQIVHVNGKLLNVVTN
jgi:leucyl-tRNA synthetase